MVLISSNSLQEQEWEKKTKCCFDEHHMHFLWCWIKKEKCNGVINIYKKTISSFSTRVSMSYWPHVFCFQVNFHFKDCWCTIINVLCLCIRPYGHSLQAVFAAGWHSFNLPLQCDESLIPTLDLIYWLTCENLSYFPSTWTPHVRGNVFPTQSPILYSIKA